MKIVEVSYGFTFNRPNYQSERIDLKAMIEPGDNVDLAMAELAADVHRLGRDIARETGWRDRADKIRAELRRA